MRTAAEAATFDGVMLVAFGGPTPGCCGERNPCPGEARCFVEGILGRDAGRETRAAEVSAHYARLGGFSPFNARTEEQAAALAEALAARGLPLPVHSGYRHWRPHVKDVMAAMARAGHRRILVVVMAPHQSTVSWDWYLKVVGEARAALGDEAPAVAVLDPWWTHPGFVAAWADRVREALAGWPAARAARAEIVFTAHAIPQAIARTGPYVRQFRETAEAVAAALGRPFHVAYQSGPEEPSIPWTEPDIRAFLRARAAPGRDFVAAPVGFLCDNVEVLYDLDVAARAEAESRGAGFARARTVETHPAFVGMLADLVAARAARGA